MADAAEDSGPAEECKCEKGAPKWVVTFGDMMSLLLCFFVLLLSFSSTNVTKFKKVSGSLEDAFGMAETDPTHQNPSSDSTKNFETIKIPNEMAMLMTVRGKAATVSKKRDDVDVESGADWVRMKVKGDTLFEPGSYTIKAGATELMDEIGSFVNGFDGTVLITGHTDGVLPESSDFNDTFLSNYELGGMRAVSVLGYFVRRQSVDQSKLIPRSMGDSDPVADNDTEEGRSANRRVEFEFRAGARADIDGSKGEFVAPEPPP